MTSPPLASYSNAAVPAKCSTNATASDLLLQRLCCSFIKDKMMVSIQDTEFCFLVGLFASLSDRQK